MSVCGAKVEVVKRIKDGFEVLPRRWVVERTFGVVWTLSTGQTHLNFRHESEILGTRAK